MLDPRIHELAHEGKNFATLTTLSKDGTPHSTIVWIDSDGENLTYNTEIHRAQFKNISADPRVSIVIWDSGNPYRYAEVNGNIKETIKGDEAKNNIEELSHRYTGGPYQMPIQSERVKILVEPVKQRMQG